MALHPAVVALLRRYEWFAAINARRYVRVCTVARPNDVQQQYITIYLLPLPPPSLRRRRQWRGMGSAPPTSRSSTSHTHFPSPSHVCSQFPTCSHSSAVTRPSSGGRGQISYCTCALYLFVF
eukprot:GHVU01201969.1.p1 GENE.GHVU01201969.1~~GHVU01201969.1.p1  ORF type:complete len:137 (-),score=4.98 GHVU01201969.1:416-781(-)